VVYGAPTAQPGQGQGQGAAPGSGVGLADRPPGLDAPPAHPGDASTDAGAPPAPDRPQVELPYVAGFDGLRAIGLVVMLAYHHGVAAARGGIFTVSMFFTLSGYLIATLALGEWARTGRMSLARFWERRARRLLPAALATVVGIVALQHWFEVGSTPRFTGDLLGALAYVANWRMAYSGGDYAATFTLEAPVQHFWSLAVEEQFYLAFPLLFVGLLALARGRWRAAGVAFAVGAAASFAAAWWTAGRHGNSGVAYYATYTRASEILVGVALAFAVVTRPARRFLASEAGVRTVRVLGFVGVVGLLWLWHTVGLADDAVFRGATALNAGLTGLVILACTSPRLGATARVLGLWPLRNLGKISYAVYLFHWPLFLLLDEDRTGLDFWPLFFVRVGATVALAVVSYHLLEAPFRARGGLLRTRARLAGFLAVPAAAIVALVLVVPVHPPETIDLTATGDEGPAFPDVVTPAGGAEPDARVLLVGDSVTWSLFGGFVTWNEANPDHQFHVDNYRAIGCPVAEAGQLRALGEVTQPNRACRRFRELLPAMLNRADYDAIVVNMGHADLADRVVDGEWRRFGDPRFDGWFEDQLGGMADILAAEGAPVLWASTTQAFMTRADDPSRGPESYVDNDPERAERLNEILVDTLANRPNFHLLDVAGWIRTIPGGQANPEYRADGVHYTVRGADELAAWMAPQILLEAGLG
jgi:peptidoglycan/LPS O-acetylase OafA/YrhL